MCAAQTRSSESCDRVCQIPQAHQRTLRCIVRAAYCFISSHNCLVSITADLHTSSVTPDLIKDLCGILTSLSISSRLLSLLLLQNSETVLFFSVNFWRNLVTFLHTGIAHSEHSAQALKEREKTLERFTIIL